MSTPKVADGPVSVPDEELVDAVLAFVEEQIDDTSEQTELRTFASLRPGLRAIVMMSRVWGEVVNGGLPQFFFNMPDVRWHAWAIEATQLMGMPLTEEALETGAILVREYLPALERKLLEWRTYYDRVGEGFGARCGSDFWDVELRELGRLGAAFIRSNPELVSLVPAALERHAESKELSQDKELPLTNGERELLFTADAFVAHLEDFTPDPSLEECVASQSTDGTRYIEYTYTDRGYGLSILCDVHVHPCAEDAEHGCEASARSLWSALGWNLKPDRQVEGQNDFYRWGDQSYYSVVLQQGEPFGFGFFARSGSKRFSLTVYGLLFQDTNAIAEALGPALDRLSAYETPKEAKPE